MCEPRLILCMFRSLAIAGLYVSKDLAFSILSLKIRYDMVQANGGGDE
jgi:hypothetical protein